MKRSHLLIALICLLLPILARGLWFYQGLYVRIPPAQAPDYGSFTIPQPNLSTPLAIASKAESQKLVVLFDKAHNNLFSLPEIDPLTNAIIAMGGDVKVLEDKYDLQRKLKEVNAFVSIAPNSAFSDQDLQHITEFVQRGGRLMVISDPTRVTQEYYESVENNVAFANRILEPFNLSFQTDYIYSITHNEGNYRNVYVQVKEKNLLTEKVTTAVFYGAHTITGQHIPLLIGDETTLSSQTDQGNDLSVASLSLNEEVLALGDMAFITTPFNQVEDNYQLIVNIAQFLAGSPRARTLADFPDLFTRPVIVLQNKDFDFSQDILKKLAEIQENYLVNGISFSMADAPQSGSDLLVMGLYPPSEELQPYTDGFGIGFDQSTTVSTPTRAPEPTIPPAATAQASPTLFPTIKPTKGKFFSVPGFGQVPNRGFSLILYSQTDGRNTLILLAESQDDLFDLLKMVENGTLKGCMLQTQIAVCPGGYVSEVVEEEEKIESTPLPELTPTPETEAVG